MKYKNVQIMRRGSIHLLVYYKDKNSFISKRVHFNSF